MNTTTNSTRADVYSRVTNRIIADLEQGVRPWLKPWNADNAAGRITRPLRHNGTPYRGVNVLLLWGEAMEKGYASNTWMTYRQAIELNAQVRKGEHGALVVVVFIFGPPSRALGSCAFGARAWPLPVGETGGSKAQGRGTGRGITRPAQGVKRRGRLGRPGPAAQALPLLTRGGDPLGKDSQKEKALTVCSAHGAQNGPRYANGIVSGWPGPQARCTQACSARPGQETVSRERERNENRIHASRTARGQAPARLAEGTPDGHDWPENKPEKFYTKLGSSVNTENNLAIGIELRKSDAGS